MERLKTSGYRVGNVDATLVLEAPRIAPHVREIRESLAGTMGVDVEQVSVKGTTAERMGAIGRGEGIACMAVATVVPG